MSDTPLLNRGVTAVKHAAENLDPETWIEPTKKGQAVCESILFLASLAALIAFLVMYLSINGGTYLFLGGNQNFGNFSATGYSSIAYPTPPVMITNLTWVYAAIFISMTTVYGLSSAYHWYMLGYYRKAVVRGDAVVTDDGTTISNPKLPSKLRVWEGYAIADFVFVLAQGPALFAMAFSLNNILGEKSNDANISLGVLALTYICAAYLVQYIVNGAHALNIMAKAGETVRLKGVLHDDLVSIIFGSIFIMALLFAWLLGSVYVQYTNIVNTQVGGNAFIAIPPPVLRAMGAYTTSILVIAVVTIVAAFMVWGNTSAIASKKELLGQDPLDLRVWMDLVIYFCTSAEHWWVFIMYCIFVFSEVGQFPANQFKYV